MQPWGPSDAAALQAYADSLESTFERLQEQAPAIHEKAKAVQVTRKSRDGLVSVTVGARGELVRLDIDPRIYRRPDSRALADAITSTIHEATQAAQDQVMDLFDPLVPREQMALHMKGDLEGVMEKMTTAMLGNAAGRERGER